MPMRTFVILIAGVILAAGVTVAFISGLSTQLNAGWVVAVTLVVALVARLALKRSGS